MPLQMISCLRSSDAPNDSGLPMDPLARDLGRYILSYMTNDKSVFGMKEVYEHGIV